MNIANFIKLAQKQKQFPKNIRLYLVSKNQYFVNDGFLKNGFDSNLTLDNNRDSILSAFSKMRFIFDEIIRLRIVGYTHNQNSIELMYLLNLIPTNRKIRIFLDWKLFSAEFARDMSRLFLVRNKTTQSVSLDDVEYIPNKKNVLSETKGFNLFKKDMIKAWKNLLDIYSTEQEKINWNELVPKLKL
ncbi:MAG: hypothetical protein OEL77_00085 [Nitrosopumilus sp.]|nr:hypothetical protein [Nitrosopumilus sp.]MDH3384400.1 hypothetical protein [Nitrosopumilus sp.]